MKFSQDYTTLLTDLDYNKHTNGSVYDRMATDAKFLFLRENTLSVPELISRDLDFERKFAQLSFKNQQSWRKDLKVSLESHLAPGETIYWKFEIWDLETQKLACQIEIWDSFSHFPEELRITLRNIWSEEKTTEKACPIPSISKPRVSKVLSFEYKTNRSDRDVFLNIPWHHAFKIIEEGRWLFSESFDLGLESAKKADCVFFTTESEYFPIEPIPAGEKIQIEVYLASYEKISCKLNQEIRSTKTSKLLALVSETMLAVSPTKMRPTKIPQEWIERFTEKF